MLRYLSIILLALLLQPAISHAQVKTTAQQDSIKEVKRRAEMEKKRRLEIAKAEAKRKAEEEKRKAAASKVITKAPNVGSAGPSGLQLLKIPVTGPYYLGMLKKEYDSTARTNTISVTTEKQAYTFKQLPYFYFGRLSVLGLALPDSIFANELPDLIAYYEKKLGTADEIKISDSLVTFSPEDGAELQGQYRVKEAKITWHYTTHDVVISYRLTDMKNNSWKGFYLIRYAGTADFIRGLDRVQEKERMIEN